MNIIEISFIGLPEESWRDNVALFSEKVLQYLSINNWEISIVFCTDDFIKDLNYKYRGKNEPTDVLSFDQNLENITETIYAGDIIISGDSVRENALHFGVLEEDEYKRVIVHGILHLTGLDHLTNNQDEIMLLKQEKILEMFKGERIF